MCERSHRLLSRSQMHFKTSCYLQKTTVKHPHPPRCIKAAFFNVAPLTWKLTAACLASSPPTAGHCFFGFFFSHVIAKRANNQGPALGEGQPGLS